ncbi:hypothetical protein SLE2022_101920 [Rubroshorea leprosula]
MEVARNLLSSPSSFPTRTHLKNSVPPPSSVLMLHEQAASTVTSIPITSVTRLFPTSVLLQEQRDECRPLLHNFKDDKVPQGVIDRRQQLETGASAPDESAFGDLGQSGQIFEQQLLWWSDLRHLLALTEENEDPLSFFTMESVVAGTKTSMDVEPFDAVALARRALSASKEAVSLANNVKLCGLEPDDSLPTSLGSNSLSKLSLEEEEAIAVRSTRLLERQSKKRRVPKLNVHVQEMSSSRRVDVKRKLSGGFNSSDLLRLFLWGPETRQLLTVKEESELIVQVQELMRLKKVKSKLQSQFEREPTLVEWAEAVGLSSQVLQSQLLSGNRSWEKLINANLRLVVHIAKKYQGHGLGLQDLLQEGSVGLMKSLEKFKPQAGCRFATYAYWWIKQSIRKAIFQHSRTIRLPENVFGLLSKLTDARRSCIQEGNRCPSKEELARRVGITVDKLENLLMTTRLPLSMQQPVWSDQNTTFQEVTAETGIEIPDISVAKQLMRQHVRNLLSVLSPKERRIIKLRYGIEGRKRNSLTEIGNMLGLSNERVRQLENRALYKLRQCLGKHGLSAYADLLV